MIPKNRNIVLLSDITELGCGEMDWVLYNPDHITPEKQRSYLKNRIHCLYGIKLTDRELNRLVCYQSFELNEFVEDIKECIEKGFKRKNKK